MKIEFKKISHEPKTINISYKKDSLSVLLEDEYIELIGDLIRCSNGLSRFSGKMQGILRLVCVRSGEEFLCPVNENLVLYFSDGIWKTQSQTNSFDLDIIEFFDGFIDFDFVVESEIESKRLDYNIKE